jgi:hypothetical protein
MAAVVECVRQHQIDLAWSRLYLELVFRTVRDAVDYGRGRGHRFKVCGGARSWDEAATMKRASAAVPEWIETPVFADCLRECSIDPENGRDVIRRLLDGKDLDHAEDLIAQINHDAWIFGRRGPCTE